MNNKCNYTVILYILASVAWSCNTWATEKKEETKPKKTVSFAQSLPVPIESADNNTTTTEPSSSSDPYYISFENCVKMYINPYEQPIKATDDARTIITRTNECCAGLSYFKRITTKYPPEHPKSLAVLRHIQDPFLTACTRGDAAVIREALDLGLPIINIKTRSSHYTPLMIVAQKECDCRDILRLLVEQKADITLQDKGSNTAYDHVMKNDYYQKWFANLPSRADEWQRLVTLLKPATTTEPLPTKPAGL